MSKVLIFIIDIDQFNLLLLNLSWCLSDKCYIDSNLKRKEKLNDQVNYHSLFATINSSLNLLAIYSLFINCNCLVQMIKSEIIY